MRAKNACPELAFVGEKHAASLRAALSVLLCAGVLTGCGEIAFKRGSGPDGFAADRRACQSRNDDPQAVRACLAQAGWHVTDMDPGPSPPPPASPAPVTAPPTPVAAPASPMTEQAASPPPSAPAGKNLAVGGWWKFGAGAADLQSAATTCVAKLGPANAPEPGYHSVTPALYACLRASGWHGLARPGG
jgi:hypothetical protein